MREHGGTTPQRGLSTRSEEELAALPDLRRSPGGRVPRWVVEEALEQQRQARLRPGRRRREQRRTDRTTRRTARRWARAPSGAAGRGGRARQAPEEPLVYVTGQVTLDTPSLTSMMHRPESVRAVILHELAHVVGLDHVDDPEQLLYGDSMGVTGFAAGDRAGLARLGAGQYVPQV